VRLRRGLYKTNLIRPRSLGAPTISVGNVTAGGTGKTPMVAWIVQWLAEQGLRPAILSRGYGAAPPGEEDGGNDEAAVLREALPGVPHYADPDRVQAAGTAKAEGADCLVLDDGFQHLRVRRDVNIVLLDALDPFGGGRLLPAGLLREPLACLKDADAIILTRTDLAAPEFLGRLREKAARLAPRAVPCDTRHRPVRLVSPSGDPPEPPESLGGRRAALFCGIGNPWGFVKTVRSLGAEVAAACFLPDHFVYDDTGLAFAAARMADAGAEIILTTKKDAVKIGRRWNGPAPLRLLEVEIEFLCGREQLEGLLKDVIVG